jgi:hypothetical protein
MTKLKNFSLLVGLLLGASLSHAQSCTIVGSACQVPNTTLSSAVSNTSSQNNTFKLASVTGIVANSTMLFIEGEADSVEAVNTVANTVTVVRGVPTSRTSAHPSGAVVWYGPPSYFQYQVPVGYPAGACTRSAALIVPYIDVDNNIFSDCIGGVWVRGISGQSVTDVLAPDSGGTAYTSLNTNGTATVAGTLNCTELHVNSNKLATGLAIMFGTTAGGSDKHLVALLDSAGNVLATSALAGATNSTASTYVRFAFTSQYLTVGPGQYFACTQSNGTSDTIRMIVTGTQDTYLTTSKTGTFGTIPTITVPTTFTTAVGPYAYLY